MTMWRETHGVRIRQLQSRFKLLPALFCRSAGVAEWSGGGPPSRSCGFESRCPLQVLAQSAATSARRASAPKWRKGKGVAKQRYPMSDFNGHFIGYDKERGYFLKKEEEIQ